MSKTHLHISLTAITKNIRILRSFCEPHVKTIGGVCLHVCVEHTLRRAHAHHGVRDTASVTPCLSQC